MFVRGTESNAEDIGSNADWRIDDDKYYSNHGAPWARNTDFTLRIAINGHAAPAFLVSNLDESTEYQPTDKPNDEIHRKAGAIVPRRRQP